MLIDCAACRVREVACGDCVVTVLLDKSQASVDFDEAEHVAVRVLAAQGLVPPLRLVPEADVTHREIA